MTKLGRNNHQNETLPFLNAAWTNRKITWHLKTSQTTTKLGRNTYQNESLLFLYFMWPHHAKVIKAAAPKLCWWKLPIPTDYVIFDYVIPWQMKSVISLLLQKLLGLKFENKKKQNKISFSLDTKSIWSMLLLEIN